MITTLRKISCDYCRQFKRGVNSLVDEVYSDEEMIKLASSIGWTRKPGWNGTTWDFCPQCTSEGRSSGDHNG